MSAARNPLTWVKTNPNTHKAEGTSLSILRNPSTRRFTLNLGEEILYRGSLVGCKQAAEDFRNDPTEPEPTAEDDILTPLDIVKNRTPDQLAADGDEPDPEPYVVGREVFADDSGETTTWSDGSTTTRYVPPYDRKEDPAPEPLESAKAHAPALDVPYHARPVERAEVIALHVADQGEAYGKAALGLVGKGMARAVRKALRRFGYFRLAGLRAA